MAGEEKNPKVWPKEATEAADFEFMMVGNEDDPIMKIHKDKLNEIIVVQGESMPAIQGGTTAATAVVLPAGPTGQNRWFDASWGYWKYNNVVLKNPLGTDGIPEGNDGTLYWDGSALTWKISKMQELRKAEANGVIKPNDENALAGGTAFNVLDKFMILSNLLPFSLLPGQIGTDGTINTSLNWLRTGRNSYDSTKGQVSIEGYGQYPSGTAAGKEAINSIRVACYTGTTFLGFIASALASSKLTFTPLPSTDNYIVQVEAGSLVGDNLANSPFLKSLKIYYGSVLQDDDLKAEKLKGTIKTPQLLTIEQKVALIDDVIEISFDQAAITTTSGKLRANGTADSATTTYRRTSVSSSSSMAHYDNSKRYYYSGEITNITDVAAVAYVNAAMTIIGVEIFPIGIHVRKELAPPNGTSFIAACSYLVDPIIEFANPILKTETSTTFYVNGTTGNDNNKGDSTTPFLTINRALLELGKKSKGTIIIYKGDYRETLSLSLLGTGDFKIYSKEGHTVRVLGSNSLTGWTKTVGYTNVYEVPYSNAIPNWSRNANPIFEDGNPSKVIDPSDYHPLQKNLTRRLPFTAILAVTSLDQVESTPASYFATGGKIFIHTSNSDDPSTNGFKYEAIARSANIGNSASSTTKKVNIQIKGIQFLYTLSGLVSIGFAYMKCIDVVSLATPSAGAFRCDTGFNELIGCEAGYCDGDGFNGHYSSFGDYVSLIDNRSNYPTTRYESCWSHDNFDDGESSHEHHNVNMNNMLCEFNGDSGSRPSNDSTYYVTNSIFRYNGWEVGHGGTPGKGEGFAVVNPSTGGSRIGCRAVLMNCQSYGNNTGYGTISSATNKIDLFNCVARNNSSAEFYAGLGTMNLWNCFGTNADPSKIKVIGNGGVMNINNDEKVI